MGNCYTKIELAAPIASVWKTIADFHDMSWAPNVITNLTIIGEINGKQVGAKRILNHAFYETLLEIDQQHYTLLYSIDDGPAPVAKETVKNYIGKVKLTALGDQTIIEWTSSFTSSIDQEITEFCNPIYAAVLADLKQTIENN